MDRQICYIGGIPQDTDQLLQSKNTMIGLGYALQAILGTNTVVDGLACTPNSPAALNVLVAPGSIYSLQNVDATAYGSVAADTTDNIVKQGIIMSTTTLSCPAPGTTGQSIVYLVQVAYQDTDSGSTVLPYYNASNPSVAWSGPSNSGVSQNTVRKGVCTVAVKAGVAATTGTQVTPSADAGYTGLYAITVANGATTITSGNIQTLSTAPFLSTKLPNVPTAIQQGKPNYALDTSVSANTITVALSPIPSALNDGQPVRVKVANSSTGATVMNVNGLGNVSCVTTSGAAFTTNTVVANGIYTFVYDANGTRWQLQNVISVDAGSLTGTTLASNVVTCSLTGFGAAASGANWYFYGSNSGGVTNLKINNPNTASGTQARLDFATGTANAYTLAWQADGATPSFNIGTGAGVTGGITIDSSASSASSVTLKSGSGGLKLNSNGGTITTQGCTTGVSLNVVSSGSNFGLTVTDTGSLGANIQMVGNGGTTPNKYIRTNNGNFQIINSAYNATIFQLTDAAVISSCTWQGNAIVGSSYVTTMLGAPVSKSANTVYQAATDGVLEATCTAGSALTLLTDSSNPPTTARQVWGAGQTSATCMVRKNDYYEVTGTGGTTAIFFYPLGA